MAQNHIMAMDLVTGQPIAKTTLKVGNGVTDPDGQIISSVSSGAPMIIASTTVVANLNADLLDGYEATDLFNLDNAQVSGILDVNHGGTNISGYTKGDVLHASATNTLAALGIGTAGQVLRVNATPDDVEWGAAVAAEGGTGIDTSGATGIPKVVGGTWSTNDTDLNDLTDVTITTIEQGDVVYYNGSAWVNLHHGTSGQFLKTQGDSANPAWATISGTITDGTDTDSTLRWSGSAWVENVNFEVSSAGAVTDGQWEADVIALDYGGTESNLGSTGPGALVQTSSGAAVTVETLDEVRGGTGLSTYTAAGAIIHSTSATALQALAIGTANQFLRVNSGATAPEWDTINLDDLANVDAMTEADQDLLFYDTDAWGRLPKGSDGEFLGMSSGSLAWLDAGTGYTWTLAGDSGTPQPITDGNTASILGGNGIDTVASATDTLTITVDADSESGGDIQPVNLTSDGVGLDINAIAGTGLAADGSANLDIDTASTVSFGANAIWTFPNGVTAKGLFVTGTPIDATHAVNKSYVDNIASGIDFKGPQFSMDQFDDTDGIRAAQWQQFGGQAAVSERFHIYDGSTLETWTAVSGSASANQFDMSGTRNDMIQSLVTRINADSALVTAEICNIEGIDGSNNCMTIIADDTSATLRNYADNGVAGNDWASSQPDYGDSSMDESDDLTAMANTQPGATNFAAPIAQGTLEEGWTYVVRGGSEAGSWYRWDDTDNQWTVIAISPTKAYQGGDGIVINSSTEPDTIEVDLGLNPGLEFSSNKLQVKDGTTLTITGSGVDIDLTNANTWSGLQTFSHASGIATDDVTERTSGAGVTVDSLLIQDGCVVEGTISTGASTIDQYEIVVVNGSGTLDKADGDNALSSVLGIAMEQKTTGNPIKIARSGLYEVAMVGSLSPNEGEPVFVSLTAGDGTNDVSSFSSGDRILCVGFITDTTNYVGFGRVEIEINIGEPVLLS